MNNPNAKFNLNFRWALSGSLFYECIKSLHNFLLLKILSPNIYGLFGGLISTIFLISRITDLGLSNSLAPFLKEATISKQSFKDVILKFYLTIHLPFQIVSFVFLPLITLKFFHINLTTTSLIIVIALIIIETLRSFVRLFLHTTFKSKNVVLIELTGFAIYLIGTWSPIIMFHAKPSVISLLLPLLADSLFSLTLLTMIIIKQNYIPLKNTYQASSKKIKKRIIKTRILNTVLRLSREFFTSNFLTPFFISKFSLHQAGIFFFSSSISNSLLAIFRGTINYPGAALLAAFKDASQSEKKAAFNLLCQKLTLFIAPPVIFFITNFQFLIKMGFSAKLSHNIIALFGLFITITLFEFFFILYEQFYVIEERIDRFLGFKLIEFILFYIFVLSPAQTSIAITLVSIIVIKFVSFTIIATDAYILWKITPTLRTTKKNLALFFLVSIAFYLLFLHLT